MRTLLALLITLGATAGDPPAKTSATDSKIRVRAYGDVGAPETTVDILFVGDGYTKAQLADNGKYWKDVQRYSKRLLDEAPFSWLSKKLSIRAAFVVSKDDDCDPEPKVDKFDTAFDSHFDAPDGRLLVFGDAKALAQVVKDTGPCDIVFVMVNTERYGGAGTELDEICLRGRALPAPTFSAQDTASFMIAVHELGHSFALLADEYEDAELHETFPLPKAGKDLSTPNVTMPDQFDATSRKTLAETLRWRHFLALPGADAQKWVHEGGYYRAKGVFRPWRRCMMMSISGGEPFCPICCEEVAKSIYATCGETWDDAAWHKAHPLSVWK